MTADRHDGAVDPDRANRQASIPLVRVTGLHVTYPGPPKVSALRGVDVSISSGELVAIVGPSGSGKSTLMNILGLLERPTAGRYELDGVDVSSMNETKRAQVRARHIGFVFQSFHLPEERTASENVQLAMAAQQTPRRQRPALAEDLLADVGLADRASAPTGQLSGGERQRVAIARALVGQPPLLLCDEPTGNLDSQATSVVLELLAVQHRQGVAVVVVTHDDEVARWAERTIRVRDGLVSPDPTPALT